MDDIPGVKRIIIETEGKKKNYKLNKQKCRVQERQDGKITKHQTKRVHMILHSQTAFSSTIQQY